MPNSQKTNVQLNDSRQLAFLALKAVQDGGYADVVVDNVLTKHPLPERDRRLMTELVYGTVRRQRTLDAIIDALASKPADRQPPDVRSLLQLGLYQLHYLTHIPPSAAVNTTVNLAKSNRLAGLSGFINGVLRRYVRLVEAGEPVMTLPSESIAQLGIQYSFPDWIIQTFVDQIGAEHTAVLCEWLNQPPSLDLRVNQQRMSVAEMVTQFEAAGLDVVPLPISGALRLLQGGVVRSLPGFSEGWWTVQDSSAQLVSHVLDPQPGEVVIDACAAPGGKTTHIAELMGDRGTVWGCDRNANRLKRLAQSCDRLGLSSIQLCTGDARELTQFINQGDRVLLDVPCSGLGTLHRHADARWRQTLLTTHELAALQLDLLIHTANWVKPGGCLVYSTCTLNPLENQQVVQQFLSDRPDWELTPITAAIALPYVTPHGWLTIWPHQHKMDGFFVARLQRSPLSRDT